MRAYGMAFADTHVKLICFVQHMPNQSQSSTLLVLDAVVERGENIVQYFQKAAVEAIFSETNYKNLLVLLEHYRPSALMLIADQLVDDIELQLSLIQEHISLPAIIQLQVEKEGDVERCLNVGANVYLAGDVNYERLPSVYRTALSRYSVDRERTDRIQQLEKLLGDRKLIDQAKGLLMQHKGMSEQEAYQHMRSSAMSQNKSMSELSKIIIDVFKIL